MKIIRVYLTYETLYDVKIKVKQAQRVPGGLSSQIS
jgi:hypothetical protein